MKILSAPQIRQWDAYTIEQEPISSLDLMERASTAFTQAFACYYPLARYPSVTICCGRGNNGGDGLAVGRLLQVMGYQCHCLLLDGPRSADCQAQLDAYRGPWSLVAEDAPLPQLQADVLIDALFGTGLNRPLQGAAARLLVHMNASGLPIASIDLPSGLYADQHTPPEAPCIRASHTISFQSPKLAFLLPENQERVGCWHTVPIGLHHAFEQQADTPYHFVEADMLRGMLPSRGRFSHKGTFGHALVAGGSYSKIGAVVLACRAALRSGVGLLTALAPACGYDILQGQVPEAMCLSDRSHEVLTYAPSNLERFQAIGVGPGMGTDSASSGMLAELFYHVHRPMVIDADALNLLAAYPELWPMVPADSILTPHPKEFERLAGGCDWGDDFERLQRLGDMAREKGVYILLKGAYSCLATPQGEAYFNPTGNPGMATGGSGDVLTGVLTALLAQGLPPQQAALLGVYAHGLAGDLAAEAVGQMGMTASDLVTYLPAAWKGLQVP